MLCIVLFSNSVFAQTPANNAACLKALNNHKFLKFKQLLGAQLSQLANVTQGLSINEVALYILTNVKAINENCSKNVTDFFIGKFDSTFIIHVKRLAAQGNCADLPSCNARAREYEQYVKALNGGSAGLAQANRADDRYTGASTSPTAETGQFSVCCAGPMGGKVNAQDGGGYCENNETNYPCFANTSAPLKDNDPGRAAFYSRFGKTRQLEEWNKKYGSGSLPTPARSGTTPAARPAASPSSR